MLTQNEQSIVFNGAERAGEVVGQNGAGEDISGVGHQFGRKTANTPPNFRGGAEKVVVHMHWLTWLLWRPILIRMNLLHIVSTCLKDIMAFVLRMEGL